MSAEIEVADELRALRTQARVQVAVMVASLVLVFLWFNVVAFSLNQRTFSRDAYEAAAPAAVTASPMLLFLVALFIAICFTGVYLQVLRTATRRSK